MSEKGFVDILLRRRERTLSSLREAWGGGFWSIYSYSNEEPQYSVREGSMKSRWQSKKHVVGTVCCVLVLLKTMRPALGERSYIAFLSIEMLCNEIYLYISILYLPLCGKRWKDINKERFFSSYFFFMESLYSDIIPDGELQGNISKNYFLSFPFDPWSCLLCLYGPLAFWESGANYVSISLLNTYVYGPSKIFL